jgi:hypothetical protein
MPNTYSFIASTTLGSTTASVTFSSISSGFNNLILSISARGETLGVADSIRIQCNSDTGSNYSARNLTTSGTSITNFGFANQTVMNFSRSSMGDAATANVFNNSEIYIGAFTSVNSIPISSSGAGENLATEAYQGIGGGLYRGSAAISSLTILPGGANFLTGSSFYLYGIKNT